jgi:hypothetical protein
MVSREWNNIKVDDTSISRRRILSGDYVERTKNDFLFFAEEGNILGNSRFEVLTVVKILMLVLYAFRRYIPPKYL